MMKYKSGYKYQLEEDEVFISSVVIDKVIKTKYINLTNGALIIKAGYAWDGPSGPTYDSVNSMRGSLYHDAMYQLMRMKKVPARWRVKADDDFGTILKNDGMWNPRRWMWVNMVKKLAAGAADPSSIKKVHEAP
jgi:hypothetical protein